MELDLDSMNKNTLKQLLHIIAKHEDVDGVNCAGAIMVGMIIQDIISGEFSLDELTDKRKTPINICPKQFDIYMKFYHNN